MGHGNPGALLPPKVSILGGGLVGPGPVEKVQGDIFTVALEEEEGMGPAQVHEIPQGVQAAGGFLQNIPQDQQNVVGGKLDLFQQALEKGKIAVNVADDQHPPVRRQGEGTYNRSHGVIAPGLPGQSSRSFPGGLSPAAPPAPGRAATSSPRVSMMPRAEEGPLTVQQLGNHRRQGDDNIRHNVGQHHLGFFSGQFLN